MTSTVHDLEHRQAAEHRTTTEAHTEAHEGINLTVGRGILWLLGVTVAWFLALMAFNALMDRL